MKRALLIVVALLASAAGAHADHYATIYHDLIRPHGHARDAAVGDANLEDCFHRTGDNRTRSDSLAFKRCMAGHGYRWMSTRLVRDSSPAANGVPAPAQNPDADWSFHDLSFWGWN